MAPLTRSRAALASLIAFALTALLGLVVGGCDASPADVSACYRKCSAGGGTVGDSPIRGVRQEWFSDKGTACICVYPMPFADGGSR
jgi:hypothetical protein